MGLFDMFGAGGGKLGIQPQSSQVTPGGGLAGAVGFQSGSRPQQITSITLKLVLNETRIEQTPQGPQQRTHARDVVPPQTLSGPFTTTPGQTHPFTFNLAIPHGLPNSTPQLASYRLVAAADIDGEIDPGATVDIQVVGGSNPAMMGGMPGAMPGAMMGGMPGAMPGAMMGGMPAPVAPVQIGSPVMGQWQDGQWHAGRVVAMQNGMFGVDWDNPALGQSSWLQPQQVQLVGAMMGSAPMMSPGMGAPPPAKPSHDPYSKQAHEVQAKSSHDPSGKQAHAAPAIGAPVHAQWQDGHWHPARVVAHQNGMVGVDWDNPALGQSSWVQPHQVRAV